MAYRKNRAQRVRTAQRLRDKGWKVQDIAAEMGLVEATIYKYFADPHGRNQRVYDAIRKPRVVIDARARQHAERMERVHVAHKLRQKGLSYREIRKTMGLGKSTISSYFNDPDGRRQLEWQLAYINRKKRRQHKTLTKGGAELEYNRMNIPISRKIRMRPVWTHRQRRIYGQNQLPPATDEEKLDAIRVLEDKSAERQAPALWYEAFRIFEEESE